MSFVTERLKQLSALSDWPEAPVPIVAQINEHIPHLCGLTHDYLLRDDPLSMAECSLLVYEYYDIALLIANHDVYNLEAEAIGQKMSFKKNRYPDIDSTDFLIKAESDLDKIKFPGLDCGRFPYLLKYFDAYRRYAGVDPATDGCAPFSLACNLYGSQQLIIGIGNKTAFIKEMFRRIVNDYLIPLYTALEAANPARTLYGLADAFASPPLLSPALFEEYVVKYYDEIAAALPGLKFVEEGIWGVGVLPEKKRQRFADDLIHVGGGLTGMDPDVSQIGAQWYRDYADAREVPLTLGLSASLLQDGPVEKIVERIKDYVLTGKKGRTPFSFFFNCVTMATPPEHVHAAVAAVKAYGRPGADHSAKFEYPQRESFIDFVRQKKKDNQDSYLFKWLEVSTLDL